MAKDPFEQFAMPGEMRAFAERGVAQARQAFEGFVEAATKAVGQFQGSARAAQSGATEIAQKSISYAEQNVEATFDLETHEGERRRRGFRSAVGIFKPANAGAFEPSAGPWTKCRQNCGRCC